MPRTSNGKLASIAHVAGSMSLNSVAVIIPRSQTRRNLETRIITKATYSQKSRRVSNYSVERLPLSIENMSHYKRYAYKSHSIIGRSIGDLRSFPEAQFTGHHYFGVTEKPSRYNVVITELREAYEGKKSNVSVDVGEGSRQTEERRNVF
jgi:hypothetical protein